MGYFRLVGNDRLGDLSIRRDGAVMETALDDRALRDHGLDPAALVQIELEPGDLAFWHLCTLHGSGPNRSAGDRRLYINGYVRAANCERGEWAFRAGRPCPLGAPVLVSYEDLHRRPEPHFIDD